MWPSNPADDTMFLVGTDEGLIYKCTTEYSSKYLETYPAHNTPIYNIAWNRYVPSIFITCAAEWMIKIWDHNSTWETSSNRLYLFYKLVLLGNHCSCSTWTPKWATWRGRRTRPQCLRPWRSTARSTCSTSTLTSTTPSALSPSSPGRRPAQPHLVQLPSPHHYRRWQQVNRIIPFKIDYESSIKREKFGNPEARIDRASTCAPMVTWSRVAAFRVLCTFCVLCTLISPWSMRILDLHMCDMLHVEWRYIEIEWFICHFRGSVHCLKLSPNLRRQTKDVKAALNNKEPKKALELEIKKLDNLLAMVRQPVDKSKTDGDDFPWNKLGIILKCCRFPASVWKKGWRVVILCERHLAMSIWGEERERKGRNLRNGELHFPEIEMVPISWLGIKFS